MEGESQAYTHIHSQNSSQGAATSLHTSLQGSLEERPLFRWLYGLNVRGREKTGNLGVGTTLEEAVLTASKEVLMERKMKQQGWFEGMPLTFHFPWVVTLCAYLCQRLRICSSLPYIMLKVMCYVFGTEVSCKVLLITAVCSAHVSCLL